MKWAPLTTALILLVLLLALGDSVSASKPFQPSYDLVSVSPDTAGGNGDVVQQMSVPAGDHPIGKIEWSLPQFWDITVVTKFAIVGSGQLQVDTACIGTVQTYPLTILENHRFPVGDPLAVETRWLVQGYPFGGFFIIVRGSAAAGQTLELSMFSAGPTVCSPMSLDLTFQGISSTNPDPPGPGGPVPGGETVLTNPGAGAHPWSLQLHSWPGTSQHTVSLCDEAIIGGADPDPDADGVHDACDDLCPNTAPGADVDVNGCSQAQVDQDADGVCDPGASSPSWCTGSDNCPAVPNLDQLDFDEDGVGDVCDHSDGDGIVDADDNCPTVNNAGQADGDSDGVGDACENPPCDVLPDCDLDSLGYSATQAGGACPAPSALPRLRDCIELRLGTDPTDDCPDDASDDAWGPDANRSGASYRNVDGFDVFLWAQRFGSTAITTAPGKLPYDRRYDLNADGAIDGLDIFVLALYFNETCV